MLVLIAFVIFEAAMAAWLVAFSTGNYDPALSVPTLNAANPMGYAYGLMAQSEIRHNVMTGFIAVWIIGSVVLYILSRVTRTRLLFTREK
jgi:hypothetical protein